MEALHYFPSAVQQAVPSGEGRLMSQLEDDPVFINALAGLRPAEDLAREVNASETDVRAALRRLSIPRDGEPVLWGYLDVRGCAGDAVVAVDSVLGFDGAVIALPEFPGIVAISLPLRLLQLEQTRAVDAAYDLATMDDEWPSGAEFIGCNIGTVPNPELTDDELTF